TVDPMAGPALQWEPSADPQSGIDRYEVWMDGKKVAEVPKEMYTAYPQGYGEHTWRVVAVNGAGLKRKSEKSTFSARTLAVCRDDRPEKRFLNRPVSSSIQEAVDKADPGATILVYPGTYRESVTVDVPGLTIKAAQWSEATRPDEPEIIDAHGEAAALTITAENVTVHGLSLENASRAAIRVQADGAAIAKNHVIGPKDVPGVLLTDAGGVSVRRNRLYRLQSGIQVRGISRDVSIRDNTVHHCRAGITVQGGVRGLTAKHNDLEKNGRGILISAEDGTLPSDIAAHYNDLRKSSEAGLQVKAGDSTDLADNTVDARHNWWGAADGPSGRGPGSGTAVSGGVHFEPWLKQYWQPTWDSLERDSVPEWFKDSKFGIYMHWTPTSVPAHGGWYSNSMYGGKNTGWHAENYGHQSMFGFKDFIPMFRLQKWDPDRWAALFKETGCRFVGMTSEHCDGFAMWDSALPQWNAVQMGPRRDVVGELADAVRNHGMRLVLSQHRVFRAEFENWTERRDDWDSTNPKYWGLYMPPFRSGKRSREWVQDWKDRLVEKINKYQPSLMWMESGWEEGGRSSVKDDTYFKPEKKSFVAEYYNKALEWGIEPVVTYKWEHRYDYGVWNYEYNLEQVEKIRDEAWLADWPMNGWYYHRDVAGDDYKSTGRILTTLIDIVSKNGVVMLNIPPKADGTIPAGVRKRLRGIGRWMEVNGEAIYGTRPWETFNEGEDIRFTRSKDGETIYVICLSWPGDRLEVQSLASGSELCPRDIEKVSMLGTDGELEWSRTGKALQVDMPKERPCEHAFAVRVDLSGE
ncbi:MAG: alpha-L-fucosidase, partial [Planctomycetota bacterium]